MFGIGKKREEAQVTAGCCGATASAQTAPKAEGGCVVRILGSGCRNCHQLYENTKAAVAAMGRADSIAVEYVTDMPTITAYGVMSMPALVCCEKVISMGRVLKPAEVQKLLERSGC